MSLDLHLCRQDELPDLQNFIDEHWARGHVLARSRLLMDFQHRAPGERDYNFVLARHDQAILGVLGFIPTALYDPALAAENTLWYALWKVRPDAGLPGLGLKLMQWLVEHHPARSVGTVGINTTVEKLYRALGYRTGMLQHYYVLRKGCTAFSLAQVPADWPAAPEVFPDSALSWEVMTAEKLQALGDWRGGEERVPAKTPEFMRRRYLDHPIYRYQVLGLRHHEQLQALVVLRRAEHLGHSALRVVDLLGEPECLRGAAGLWQTLLCEQNAEYLDLLCHGLDESVLSSSGLRLLDHSGPLVIPNYFEPFEPRNVPVRFAFRPQAGKSFVLFKADADQDRPSLL